MRDRPQRESHLPEDMEAQNNNHVPAITKTQMPIVSQERHNPQSRILDFCEEIVYFLPSVKW